MSTLFTSFMQPSFPTLTTFISFNSFLKFTTTSFIIVTNYSMCVCIQLLYIFNRML